MSMVDTAPGKIQVRDLNFYYGKFHALKNINFGYREEQSRHLSVRLAVVNPRCCAPLTKCIRSIRSSARR